MNRAAQILVVDDHPITRKTTCSLLQAEPDFEVVCDATNGTDAIVQAKHPHPDVAILDINMPAMNRLEAARHINTAAPSAEIASLSQHTAPYTIRQPINVA